MEKHSQNSTSYSKWSTITNAQMCTDTHSYYTLRSLDATASRYHSLGPRKLYVYKNLSKMHFYRSFYHFSQTNFNFTISAKLLIFTRKYACCIIISSSAETNIFSTLELNIGIKSRDGCV